MHMPHLSSTINFFVGRTKSRSKILWKIVLHTQNVSDFMNENLKNWIKLQQWTMDQTSKMDPNPKMYQYSKKDQNPKMGKIQKWITIQWWTTIKKWIKIRKCIKMQKWIKSKNGSLKMDQNHMKALLLKYVQCFHHWLQKANP